MKSMLPDHAVAITGLPAAMASAIGNPKPSERCSEMNASLQAISESVSSLESTLPTILMYGYAPGWFDDPARGTWYAEQFHSAAGWGMYVVAILLWLSIVSLMRWALLPIQRFTLASQ